jgi:hypothetical protein
MADKTVNEKYKLPRQDVGIGMPFPKKIVIEPRDADGKLVTERIGADELVDIAGRIGTVDGLCTLFFIHKPHFTHASGQDIMDWLCDNGLVARAKTW